MLQPRIQARVLLAASILPSTSILLSSAFLRLSLTPSTCTSGALPRPAHLPPRRHASHAAQGRANKAAPGPGKRLGAKKGDSEPVVPGNIIFRQRGTKWFPGENTSIGRDHTIFAMQKGFVRYYRDPARHPERKYIGVVFEPEERLPRGANAVRRRRLGLQARVMGPVELERATLQVTPMVSEPPSDLGLREGYQYRESNRSIGRSAERAGVRVDFDRKDVYAARARAKRAWRKKKAMTKVTKRKKR